MAINEIYESVKEYVRQLERNKEKHLINPEKDFTRHRKISFSDCVMSVLCMSGGTLFSEILEAQKYLQANLLRNLCYPNEQIRYIGCPY